ncbi:cysteine desulfurase-like protein [Planococcus sp. N028]|uniref:Cysteine desulfurase-like protein n=1 Tax=Planococcus shixiaomingii TaxID=3058393 RepID=A0ABT8N425_9BACL|nr:MULTISPECIES: cysteine desulfurase-like protein [unclassified Planococcus (in: firmicutes)]MDN7242637.1 cysteine desulfurase-like protein [Planococcus sp. N028]WKA55730.1 cysteine desulfurase-like protein [Planococcus sp. N022]
MKTEETTFPISEVREQFPALKRTYKGNQVAYFDGPGGSQVVKSAIQAIAQYMENGGANLHGCFPSSWETEAIIEEAKSAVADFLGVQVNEVAFGANMTTLTYAISRALGKKWGTNDEIVVTEMDHRANVDPWLQLAEDRGLKVRWIKVDTETLTLDLSDLNEVINDKTRLVAIGMASNAVGTIVDMAPIVKRAKEVGALVAADAVHAAPHIAIDRDRQGIDILLCSAYKFFGPHIGIAAIKEEILKNLEPYKLVPAPSYYPDNLETGTQNHEGIAGIGPAIQFFASFGEGETRRERIQTGIERIEAYENYLAARLRDGLSAIEKVKVFAAARDVPKTPTIAFQVAGVAPEEVCKIMAEEHGIFVASGHFYASTLADRLDINKSGGWIRAGLAPYNTEEEVDRLIRAVAAL